MNIEDLHNYCQSLPWAEETFPFDEVTMVMKVGGKMFALIPLDATETSIALKCDPNMAIALREKYRCVQPAFHMNKTHWNTITMSSEITSGQIKEWINHSYDLVFSGLPKKVKETLK